MKQILPSLKEKKRYLAYEVISEKPIEKAIIFKEIKAKTKELIGLEGLAKANITILDTFKDNKGVLKVNNKYLNHIRSSFILIDNIDKNKTLIKTLGVSGTLKKVSRFIGG